MVVEIHLQRSAEHKLEFPAIELVQQHLTAVLECQMQELHLTVLLIQIRELDILALVKPEKTTTTQAVHARLILLVVHQEPTTLQVGLVREQTTRV